MRSIRVERLVYSTSGGGARPFTVSVGDRSVGVRVRRCGSSPDDVVRLTIHTTTTDKLPGTRDLAEHRHVSTRQRGEGRVITVTLNANDNILVPIGPQPPDNEKQRFWESVVDFLDHALPGYTFM